MFMFELFSFSSRESTGAEWGMNPRSEREESRSWRNEVTSLIVVIAIKFWGTLRSFMKLAE